ncbi:unnamed protein product [Cyprideis torosa]|uniref:non-specific serine/threonine protein kinase n=1 Tax=Cyprideis torosa TaxID=163714 RepID=A0A7R8W6U3_9CRUS|nr:unnamed protein product [Cyprideis torosa]CAG0886874.1 unnamed protein product [Cyprideis torosa]
MDDEDTTTVRQENEVEVLQSIYLGEFEDVRKADAWKVRRPPEFKLFLKPTESMGGPNAYAQIVLHLKCPENYPDVPPEIWLREAKGLSNDQVRDLHSQLKASAEELVGEVMALELARFVQDYLRDNARPPTKSFYDEMLSNQRKLEEEKQRQHEELLKQRKRMQEEERQKILETMAKRQEAIKEENKRVRLLSTGQHQGSCQVKVKGHGVVERGQCVEHDPRGFTVYGGFDSSKGIPLTIKEWVRHVPRVSKRAKKRGDDPRTDELNRFLQDVAAIESVLSSIRSLEVSDYVIPYHFFTHGHEKHGYVLRYMDPFPPSLTLQWHLDLRIAASESELKLYASDVLEGLSHLHENGIHHGDLRPSSLRVDGHGHIRIGDYQMLKLLTELSLSEAKGSGDNAEDNFDDFWKDPADWSPEQKDLRRSGIILFSLSQAKLIKDLALDIDYRIPEDLKDLISLLCSSQNTSAYVLLAHSFLKASEKTTQINRVRRDVIVNPDPADEAEIELPSMLTETSRLKSEFSVLKIIGMGGFGCVLKVRNKLDGNVYAIKRIELNPENRTLNRKITREVKLLSRLNHENVVRYYNSWIETARVENVEGTSTSTSYTASSKFDDHSSESNIKSDQSDGMSEFDVKFDGESGNFAAAAEDNSDSDSDLEGEDLFGTSFMVINNSSDDSVAFEDSCGLKQQSDASQSCDASKENVGEGQDTQPQKYKFIQAMYIQMEFCEKATLRNLIDGNLYRDKPNLWRLFHEIVEGLSHIHEQGMIHRDLKPVNLFLDAGGHIKIGDFGLATTDPLATSEPIESHELTNSTAHTGRIGTALYVAPELLARSVSGKLRYDQKVDLYSLGIIFFEMSYRPLKTGMERSRLIEGIRQPTPVFPDDFDGKKQMEIVKLLLQQDPSRRPSSKKLQELLPRKTDNKWYELVDRTIKAPESKEYKHLIQRCMSQVSSLVADASYDLYASKLFVTKKSSLALSHVIRILEKTFELHGAVRISPHLLQPRSKEQTLDGSVLLMDHAGDILYLPHNLRDPFLKLVARSNFGNLKRFDIGRVYRQTKVFGLHPRELFEAAFDIITFHPDPMADAEVLWIIQNALQTFPHLADRRLVITLNHVNIIKGVCAHFQLSTSITDKILRFLRSRVLCSGGKTEFQNQLMSFGLDVGGAEFLTTLFLTRTSVDDIKQTLKLVERSRSSFATKHVQQGLKDIDEVLKAMKLFSIDCQIRVAPGMLVSNLENYSGVMYEVELKNERGGLDVFAAGGRYDGLLQDYRRAYSLGMQTVRDSQQYGVGLSIALDKIIHGLLTSDSDGAVAVCDVFLFYSDEVTKSILINVAKELWNIGIRSYLSYEYLDSPEEAQVLASELGAGHVVYIRPSEPTGFRLRSLVRDKLAERRVKSQTELLEFFKAGKESENASFTSKTEGSSSQKSEAAVSSTGPQIRVNFVTEEKLSSNARRRYENQMHLQLGSVLEMFHAKNEILVLGVDIPLDVIKSIAAFTEFSSRQDLIESFHAVEERHPRYKKYFSLLRDELVSVRVSPKNKAIVVMFSLSDHGYKVLL